MKTLQMKALILMGCLALAGCTASSVILKPGAEDVQISTEPPGEGYSLIGPISARHGGGCGLFGSAGRYDEAINMLRNIAVERSADFVQLLRQQPEHMRGPMCLDRAYNIEGLAFMHSQ